MIRMPGRSHAGPLADLTGEERALRDRLVAHVEHLGGEIGERNVWHDDALVKAQGYLEGELCSSGYAVQRQGFQAAGRIVHNLEVEEPGTEQPGEILVVGAHYDSVLGSPGANDNGTGVAAVLELARLARGRDSARGLRFVLFVNEEPPFFQTSSMGSLVYARRCRERREHVRGMLSLETIGCYDDRPGSQRYPFPFSLFYPSRGNFIGFVGNRASRGFLHAVIGSFRRHTAFPSEGLAAPSWVPGVSWSDQWSFWRQGYSAIMVTDTAPYRYPHYHSAHDTPDKIDGDRLARVVMGLDRTVRELAGGEGRSVA